MNATTTAPLADDTEELISEWAVRVLEFRSGSRRFTDTAAGRESDLVTAFRVRDRLNNRLRCSVKNVSTCTDEMADILRSADEMLVGLTEEAGTLDALTAHDHYAKAGEWWWKRLLTRAA